jgi:uncharacterized protein (TIGR00369 family)
MENALSQPSTAYSSLLDYVARLKRGDAAPPPIAEVLGFDVVAIEPDRVVFELDTDPARHGNPMGTVHGGVVCTLADSAMGMAYAATLGADETFTTLELKINFLRPVWRTRLTATGRVVQAGRSVGLTECDVVDDKGRLVARASSTCMTLRGDQGSGR